MTDEEMDARLRAAGAAWRAAEAEESQLLVPADQTPMASPPADPPRGVRSHRVALLASAAVVVAALVATGAYVFRHTGSAGQRSAADVAALRGTVWQLLGYGDERQANSGATLYVDGSGKLVADDSCSLLTATTRIAGDRVEISDLDERFYNCTDSVGEVTFDRGRSVLRADPTWSVDGAALTLSAHGTTMHFAAAANLLPPTADRPTLTGATWRLSKAVDPTGAARPVGTGATLRIDRGRLVTSDTCNTLSGEVTVDWPNLDPHDLATTEIGCPDTSTPQLIDRVFAGRVVTDLRGATLTLTRAGVGTLTYTWQPEDEVAVDTGRLTASPWRLSSVAGEPAGGAIVLTFGPDGSLGLAGCVTLTGTVALGAGTLTAAGLPSEPPAGCPDAMSTVLSFLTSEPVLWSIQQDRLVVYGGGSQAFSAVFAPVTPDRVAVTPASRLVGPTWRLSSVQVDSGDTSSGSGASSSDVTLVLTGQTFRLSSRCESYAGDVAITGQELRFSGRRDVGSTFCTSPEAVAARPVFEGPATWTIRHGELRIRRGDVTLTFT
jgi:heat shock protein HslJ